MSDVITKVNRQSVLVIGASGRLGIECIRNLAKHSSCPEIHAFCNDSATLSPTDWALCTSVIEGSARYAVDIEEALRSTRANWIVLCVGTGDDTNPSNIRTFAGQNVAYVLQKSEFLSVRVFAVSMASLNKFNRIRLRCVWHDHKGQEDALRVLGFRVVIVRSTRFMAYDSRCQYISSQSCSFGSISSKSTSSSFEGLEQATPPSSPVRATKCCSLFQNSDFSDICANSKTLKVEDSSSSTDLMDSCPHPNLAQPRRSSRWLRKFERPDVMVGAKRSKIVEFGNHEWPPSNTTSRADLALWITQQICHQNLSKFERTWIGSNFQNKTVPRDGSVQFVNVTSIEVTL